MNQEFFSPQARANETIFRITSRLLVALMLACAAQTFASLVGQALPEWYPWYLSITAFFTSLACLGYFPRLKKLGILNRAWLLNLLSIWLVLLTSIRLLIGLGKGPQAFWQELMQWPQDSTLILSPEFFFAIMVALITWFFADSYANLLAKLDLDFIRQQQEYADPYEASQPPVRQRLLLLTLKIGIGLVFLTALARIDLRAIAFDSSLIIEQLPRLAGGGLTTLLYFFLALILFSLTQLMHLQGRWGLNQIPIRENLAGHWLQYSLAFLTILTLLVVFLPTHYSLGILAAIGYALRWLIGAIFYLGQLILSFFVRLVNAIFSVSGQEEPLEEVPLPEMGPPEFLADPGDETIIPDAPPWMAFIRLVFFWLTLLAIIFFAFRYVLQNNRELLTTLRRFRLLALLTDLLARLFGFLRATSETLNETIQAGMARLRPRRGLRQTVGDWINLRLLDPRRKIYFYYQALLRRSNESGLSRNLSQTPSEFAQRLDQALPNSQPDIDTLTNAFIEARYTRREIPAESAGLARRTWQRLRQAIGKRRAS